jgi:hypothetical protein
VLIPGDMGRYSFVLAGPSQAMDQTWDRAAMGAGRVMSGLREEERPGPSALSGAGRPRHLRAQRQHGDGR